MNFDTDRGIPVSVSFVFVVFVVFVVSIVLFGDIMTNHVVDQWLDECVQNLQDQPWSLKTLKRLVDLESRPIESFPQSCYIKSNFVIPAGLDDTKELLPLFSRAVKEIVEQIDLSVYQQITKILEASETVVPTGIIGIQATLLWLSDYFKKNHTRSINRSLAMTDSSLVNLKATDRISVGCWQPESLKTMQFYGAPNSLKRFNLAAQQDAITITTYCLGTQTPIEGTWPQFGVAQWQGYGLRGRFNYDCPVGGTKVILDCAVKVTRVNFEHCCLIPEESFV